MAGATSLGLVRDELFATMEEAEQSLEQFITERENVSLLQQAIESLQQVRGTLKLIELTGAEMLAQEIQQQATDIPAGASEVRDIQLAALSTALFVLRRYLENLDAHREEMPEVLLPAINDLRKAGNQPPLPESFFFSVRLDQPRPLRDGTTRETVDLTVEGRRLRQMYQVGLLGFIREQSSASSLRLMLRALTRLDGLLGDDPRSRLCWIAAAAIEAQVDGQLLPRKSRKQLFARIDRELRQLLAAPDYEAPRLLLKEMLYLVALADTHGPLAEPLRETFSLTALPFTDHLLEEEYQRLTGPGQAVMRSLSSAIGEELASVKDLLDLIERGAADEESLGNLHALLGKLSKTLAMVGLTSAGNALQTQLAEVSSWVDQNPVPANALHGLADAVLYVEGMVASLDRGERREARPRAVPGADAQSFAIHQLAEARILVIDEAQACLALAKRAITAYLESEGDKMHLLNVPGTLQTARGGLWFLDQPRAAAMIGACADYIQRQMLEAPARPSEQMLETLADALASLEYYLEAGTLLPDEHSEVLDLAADSVRALGMPVAA
ncbi:ferrous iron transporter B [Pseudomonas kuykendallii]|uniref:ferrous iron transporter B n=1 Tax=Pseudomonas kuykendallii TaxID=1007099 RepID=UPI0028D15D19|nr:ferrous iron transporter B [Pseudomonas kuykendallii]